ncbi:hypothetical protein [Tardiphaga sp.]|uniref:hypothetical protein n=1 Tax=Tardiphaga sp. TaxID=1926292 RepID=UPI0019CB7ABA|nr:hypothetical protein [Tardiphaga sp.]MBC7580303.1 hypothetical protein [Tardiphaga sp.]
MIDMAEPLFANVLFSLIARSNYPMRVSLTGSTQRSANASDGEHGTHASNIVPLWYSDASRDDRLKHWLRIVAVIRSHMTSQLIGSQNARDEEADAEYFDD